MGNIFSLNGIPVVLVASRRYMSPTAVGSENKSENPVIPQRPSTESDLAYRRIVHAEENYNNGSKALHFTQHYPTDRYDWYVFPILFPTSVYG